MKFDGKNVIRNRIYFKTSRPNSVGDKNQFDVSQRFLDKYFFYLVGIFFSGPKIKNEISLLVQKLQYLKDFFLNSKINDFDLQN